MGIENTKAHFIGIGGIGMSAMAELFHQLGAEVTGSDAGENAQTKDLKAKGITIYTGQKAEQITADMDVVVYSSAVNWDNPEMMQAKALNLPIIRRAEALAEVMRHKRGIAVGGTHGKTTTTSIISSIFLDADRDPTIAVGGRLQLIQSTARLGQGPWMVAEADESDGSFSLLNPEIAIVTNIDSDHMDHYKSFENLQKAFKQFALNIPYYGCAIVCGDDPATRQLFQECTKRIFFYGENENNDFVLKENGDSYSVFYQDEELGQLNLSVPGTHNALNALAACIATHQAGLPWLKCFAGANAYSGVDRRFQKKGEAFGAQVFDDYAHHPTEIKATIQGVRQVIGEGRFHLIYQPHRYTRTRDCWEDYLTAFSGVDELYLVDIYTAGESPIKGISSDHLARQVQGTNAHYISQDAAIVATLKERVKPGDIIMTMGAGKIWQLAEKIAEIH